MSALEETYWHARYAEKPFTNERLEYVMAHVAQLIHNSNVAKKHQAKPLLAFLPFYKKRVQVDDNVEQDIQFMFGKLKKED